MTDPISSGGRGAGHSKPTFENQPHRSRNIDTQLVQTPCQTLFAFDNCSFDDLADPVCLHQSESVESSQVWSLALFSLLIYFILVVPSRDK